MRGPIYVFHKSERERHALARDLVQAKLDVRTFDSPSALTLASNAEAPSIVLWDLDSGKVRGGLERLAARLRSPVVGLTADRDKSDSGLHTLHLPFERWRVTPVVLRLLETLPDEAAAHDDGSIFGGMRVLADTIRQGFADFIDPSVIEPPPLPARSRKVPRAGVDRSAVTMPHVVPSTEAPPLPKPATRSLSEAPVATETQPLRVLVADDDEVLQHILGYQLEAQQWQVAKTGDGEVVLQLVKSGAIDVMLLDLNLPHRNGFEILEQLQLERQSGSRPGVAGVAGKPGRDVRVIVMSEQIQEDKVVRAFALGAHDYVQKPFSPRVVVSRVERLVKGG